MKRTVLVALGLFAATPANAQVVDSDIVRENPILVSFLDNAVPADEAENVSQAQLFCSNAVTHLVLPAERREIYLTCLRYHLPSQRYKVADMTSLNDLRDFFNSNQQDRLRIETQNVAQ